MWSLIHRINLYWSSWARRRAFSYHPQRFDFGNLYILPSAFGWIFGLVVFTIFLCAINYQVSLAFFMTFLLAIIGMMSAWEAHMNLKDLSIHCLSIVEAHENESIKIIVSFNFPQQNCYALSCFFDVSQQIILEKVTSNTTITLNLLTTKRGRFSLPRLTIYSYFPLGLFRVWGYVYFDSYYYVYPRSVEPEFWPKSLVTVGRKPSINVGNEEIYDLKPVENPWVQSSRIAWKIAAKGQGWYLKTMVGEEGHYWLFRIQDLPSDNLEQNLQYLCYWLERAEQEGYFYGLELTNLKTNLSRGELHLLHCLRQLAIY